MSAQSCARRLDVGARRARQGWRATRSEGKHALDRRAQCRFEWKLTSRALPFLMHGLVACRKGNGIFGAVKGGRSPAQRTLEGIEKAFTLKGLGLDAGLASFPRARPAARTSPPSGAGLGRGNPLGLAASRIRRRVKFHWKRHRADRRL